MRFHVVTIFPNLLSSYLEESIIARAIENKHIEVHTYALRDFTVDKHRRVDGRPYGGGPGMVLWVDPIIKACKHIDKRLARKKNLKKCVVVMSPGGEMFSSSLAEKVSKKYTDIVIICGRYEGIDARVEKIVKAKKWSIGNYVLTGGELPSLVCIDAIARHIKGVLNDETSVEERRIASHDTYARPEVYEHEGKKFRVPKVLLSGNHKDIDEWRNKKRSMKTSY